MIHTAITTTTLFAALLAASPPAPALLAAPEGARKVHVEVDAGALGPDGEGMDGLISENLLPKLRDAGFEIVDERDGAIELRVRFEALRLEKFDYGIHFEFVDGDEVEAATRWVACLGCMDAKLLPLLEENAAGLIDALEGRVQSGDSVPVGGDDDPPPPVGKPVKAIGPLGYAGIGVAALGLGAVVWGAVDLGRGRVYDPGSGFDTQRTGTDFTPRGQALLGVGIGGVVLGGALLVTDIALRAKKRKQAGQQAGILVPMLAPQQVGLGWSQRF